MMTMTIAIIKKLLSHPMAIKTQGPRNKNKKRVNVNSWEFHENARLVRDRR